MNSFIPIYLLLMCGVVAGALLERWVRADAVIEAHQTLFGIGVALVCTVIAAALVALKNATEGYR